MDGWSSWCARFAWCGHYTCSCLESEKAVGAKNYSDRLIPVVVGDRERRPAGEIPWLVRRMRWFELGDAETENPKVERIAQAILGHA